MKLFGLGKDPVEALWEYVRSNIRSIDDVQQSAVQDKLSKALRAVNKGLVWGCGAAPDGTPVLEISADGIRELIPVVKDLVARAPVMPGVSVVAFKQPAKDGFSIETPVGKVDFDDMRWVPVGSAHGVEHLDIYVPLPRGTNSAVLGQMGFLFLDHTLGEYIVMTRVRELEFKLASEAPADARPFSDLPAHFGLPKV